MQAKELWFTENYCPDARFSMRVERQVYSAKSRFQQIDVYDTPAFGRVLVLDGCLMLTEKDEFIYHEMIVHPAMAVKPDIKSVLVIGGGDGGCIRELAKYDSIEKIDLCEIDREVIKVCREFLPQTALRMDDIRAELHIADGLKFVRRQKEAYDLIIVDSTDPFGPGEGLFTREFYGNCLSALTADGILINQHESPYYPEDALACQRAHRQLHAVFGKAFVYQAHIPTYPSGHWLFGFASKSGRDPRAFDGEAWDALGIKTRYYNTDLHKGSFALPNYVKEMLKNAESMGY